MRRFRCDRLLLEGCMMHCKLLLEKKKEKKSGQLGTKKKKDALQHQPSIPPFSFSSSPHPHLPPSFSFKQKFTNPSLLSHQSNPRQRHPRPRMGPSHPRTPISPMQSRKGQSSRVPSRGGGVECKVYGRDDGGEENWTWVESVGHGGGFFEGEGGFGGGGAGTGTASGWWWWSRTWWWSRWWWWQPHRWSKFLYSSASCLVVRVDDGMAAISACMHSNV